MSGQTEGAGRHATNANMRLLLLFYVISLRPKVTTISAITKISVSINDSGAQSCLGMYVLFIFIIFLKMICNRYSDISIIVEGLIAFVTSLLQYGNVTNCN